MRWELKVVRGPDEGRVFSLDPGQTLVVGRGDASDTQINDPSLSRVHFELAHTGTSILIADRGSSSGTFVNGHRVTAADIANGSVIRVGDTDLLLTNLNESSDRTTSPALGSAVKPLADLVGSRIGPYQLEKILGRGSNGVVFFARDEEHQRVAAVKVLTPQFATDEDQRQRFIRAMKTMLPIHHDRIIRLYNAGKTGPYCWAGMEYIDGEDLTQLIARTGIEGMLDWRKVWRVAVDIGLALQCAHQHKIVHRNVTPANIIRRNSDQVCLLGDLMLAKGLEGSNREQLTTPGQILGEVAYLAPERTIAGATIDSRSDLYGLGATCYALLTGNPPAIGESLVEIITQIRNSVPRPPKKFQLAVNELFSDTVMKMIAKNPDDRFQTPDELLADLMKIGRFNNLDAGI